MVCLSLLLRIVLHFKLNMLFLISSDSHSSIPCKSHCLKKNSYLVFFMCCHFYSLCCLFHPFSMGIVTPCIQYFLHLPFLHYMYIALFSVPCWHFACLHFHSLQFPFLSLGIPCNCCHFPPFRIISFSFTARCFPCIF